MKLRHVWLLLIFTQLDVYSQSGEFDQSFTHSGQTVLSSFNLQKIEVIFHAKSHECSNQKVGINRY